MRSQPLTRTQWARLAGNLLNLTTPLGLLVAKLGGAKIETGPGGLFVCEGYRLPFPVAGAFTIGNVITTGGRWADLLGRHPELLRHEERHSWQYLYCGGLPFYPLYGACLVWSILRTGDRAAANFFERSAGLAIGGYPELPVRPAAESVRALIDQTYGWLRSRS